MMSCALLIAFVGIVIVFLVTTSRWALSALALTQIVLASTTLGGCALLIGLSFLSEIGTTAVGGTPRIVFFGVRLAPLVLALTGVASLLWANAQTILSPGVGAAYGFGAMIIVLMLGGAVQAL